MTAQTPTQRAAKARQRKRERGLVKVEVWVMPEHKQTVKQLEQELTKGVKHD